MTVSLRRFSRFTDVCGFPKYRYLCACIGVWRSWLAHLLWEQGVPRSSRGIPTEKGLQVQSLFRRDNFRFTHWGPNPPDPLRRFAPKCENAMSPPDPSQLVLTDTASAGPSDDGLGSFEPMFSVGESSVTSVSLAGGLIPQTPCVASLRKRFPGIGCDSWRRCRWLLAQVSRISGAGVIFGWGPAPQNGHSRFPMAQVSPLFPHLRHHMATPAPADGHTCAKERAWRTRELAVCRKCALAEVLQGRFNLCIFARTTVK